MRVTMQVDDKMFGMIKNLREKHCVNISALLREAIVNKTIQLEGKQE